MKPSAKASAAAAALGLATSAYGLVVRPKLLTWGSDPRDLDREWPGDALTPTPHSVATRAIEIDAPAADVWPWILQVGQDRGGFYSYTWLENLFGAQITNSESLLPDYEKRKVGDTVWLAARKAYGGRARMLIAQLEAPRSMVLVYPNDADAFIGEGRAVYGTWAFILDPLDEGRTRLVMRTRAGEWDSNARRLLDFAFWEPAHFVMETRMMRTIKALAERSKSREAPAAPPSPGLNGALPTDAQALQGS
ncbi:MAG: hypothetical protein WAJ85_12060 [Candidatus Baltobacteraceae bacterium]|jgi:hypothetical protein